jgi:hypothetical protein
VRQSVKVRQKHGSGESKQAQALHRPSRCRGEANIPAHRNGPLANAKSNGQARMTLR